ncbi:MAG TPA: aminotransferase class V-fold PLP-dependent enzyme [Ilumatobacter sp.]|nr:aminotransferase class V-fold PLP-dependent enzyme [Ilumatobacter sp.]
MTLHGPHARIDDLPDRVVEYIRRRVARTELGRTAPADTVVPLLEGAITAPGLGVCRAWEVFERAVDPFTVALDGPRYLAFIPMSPSVTSVWMDALVGAASFSAESWLEAAGAVAAENQALEFIRELTGMPEGSGGCFTFGGSNGNLSAIAVGRDVAGGRRLAAVADTAHASVDNSLRLLGMEALVVPTGRSGRFTGAALERALADDGRSGELAVVIASAGSTNAGVVDELGALARVTHAHDAWLHVDGAYGAGALMLPERAHLFEGLGEADSFIVDPHKWFFCTAGTCALLYREPELAALTHTQHGPYIDVLHSTEASETWNPSDYAFQLTRRASGLPFWFTLLVHGTEAMTEAIRASVWTTAYAVERLRSIADVELVMDPQLTVVLFRKRGWDAGRWQAWARDLLEREVAFVAPTRWKGETLGRLVFLHPLTTETIVDEVLATLA